MSQACLVAQRLSWCLWLSHCNLVMATCGPRKSSLVAAISLIPEHIWLYWGPEGFSGSFRFPHTLEGRKILLSVSLWQQKGPRLAKKTWETNSSLFLLPKTPFWKGVWLLEGKFMHLYNCLFKAHVRSCALCSAIATHGGCSYSFICPQDFHGWMFVCQWQCVEEGLACEELHCATGKYFEGSATASFNSCHSPSCSKYFSSSWCYREFWDDAACHCVLWMVFSAHCPCREVFWVFRTHMLPYFITGIHVAFY